MTAFKVCLPPVHGVPEQYNEYLGNAVTHYSNNGYSLGETGCFPAQIKY